MIVFDVRPTTYDLVVAGYVKEFETTRGFIYYIDNLTC